jgi:predicted glycosyltransferase
MLIKIISQHGVDIVISDNRYGLWNKHIHTVIISHQIKIFLPGICRWRESLVNLKIRKWLNKFDQCWVPDFEGENNLAGELSHPEKQPGNLSYIGLISRFQLTRNLRDLEPAKKYEILVILSGPEPQRSTLENILIKYFRKKGTSLLIVRGIPWQKKGQTIYDRISLVSHLPSDLLYSYISSARYVICRSGYSSIMDLAILKKPAILIPTPGQTEQEYLAQSLHERRFFYKVEQKNPDFEKAFNEISEYHPRLNISGNDFLDQAIKKLETI